MEGSSALEVDKQARVAVQPVIDWLMADARQYLHRTQLLFGQFCAELLGLGIPIDRATMHIRQLHPEFEARTLLWTSDAGGAVIHDRAHGIRNNALFLESPVKTVIIDEQTVRRRLSDPDCPLDYPIVADLKESGFTDYTIRPFFFAKQERMAISFATKAPEGFSDLCLAIFDALMPAFGACVELTETKRTGRLLLDTYVGSQAGGRVWSGDIRRGQGTEIEAAIWLCDLRSFSSLSSVLPRDHIIDLLNRYFDAICEPVEQEGGEVLKFIGDAALAIFRKDTPKASVNSAIVAAEEALKSLDVLNAALRDEKCPSWPLRCGISVHYGKMMYGNIGANNRLDFTVIGSDVNLVDRLQDLTREVDPPLVLSSCAANYTCRDSRRMGRFRFKGFAEEQDAYCLGCSVDAICPDEKPAARKAVSAG